MTPYGAGGADETFHDSQAKQMLVDDEVGIEQGRLPAQAVLEACHHPSGHLLATISRGGLVQIWESRSAAWSLLHTEKADATHLAWAHPQQLLAVGTSTGQVHLLQGPTAPESKQSVQQGRQQTLGKAAASGWCKVASLQCSQAAMSAVAFAAHQHGLVLAVACSRQQPINTASREAPGQVQLWEACGQASSSMPWTLVSKFKLSEAAGTCSCLCWHVPTPGLPPLLLGGHNSGGSIWGYNSPTMTWQELGTFTAPGDDAAPALAVHWATALGRPYELIAASFGKAVVLYDVRRAPDQMMSTASNQQQHLAIGKLQVTQLQQLLHPFPVWKLEFNMLGTTLACSLDGVPEVWLWMPLMDGPWAAVSKISAEQRPSGGGEDIGMVD